VATALLVALASCTSSSSPAPAISSAPASATAPTTTGAAASSTPASVATVVLTAPVGATALPDVPAVTGGTDLAKAPTIAGSSGPPAVLIVRDLVVGTGATANATQTVTVKYVGALYLSGTVFDTSWGSGASTDVFALSGVIPGFARGIAGMKVGGRREIVVPPALGYGAHATTSIPTNSTLVFVVDLVSVTG
jgi:hypothetical protein